MSSSQGVLDTGRRPRPIQSCDACRQRKVRCNGPSMPGHRCRACLNAGLEPCTYVHPRGKPGPNKNRVIQELKEKVASLEAKLRAKSVCSLCSQPLESTLGTHSPVSYNPTADVQDDEEDASEQLFTQFQHWQISTVSEPTPKFDGSASHMTLVRNALAVKQACLGRFLKPNPCLRRPMYWEQLPWEKEVYVKQHAFVYPPKDLLDDLVELYFRNIHPILPILHRPSFQLMVAEGLHLRSQSFGAVLLAVLAIASRFSNDPRVMIGNNPLSSGWPFVAQVPIVINVLNSSVYDVQFYCLMTLFSLGGSTPHIIWVYMGLAVRFIHFHGPYLRRRDSPKFQDELWNRAFWSVYLLDILLSSYIGRCPAIRPEEYDVDPPLEVDDEYWEDGFAQPAGKSSTLSFFAHFVRLSEILGSTLGRLYASSGLKTRRGWTNEREKEFVADMDSRMNDFLDSIPPHLRWNENLQAPFFDQSALLYCTYHWIRLTIHRPWIQSKTALSGPSLFICTTAARSVLGIANVWSSQGQSIPPPFLQNPIFVSSVILVLNVFATQRAVGVSRDTEKDLGQIQTATKIFKGCESRSQGSGRMWELLQDLLSTQVEVDADVASTSQSTLMPGVSIEDLLGTSPGWSQRTDLFDTELMSLWLAAPADLVDFGQWDAYIGNITGAENWSNADEWRPEG
ncbi:fungal-specific transcription factor domain-containing protein [Roridomyces roridus]|uniref:Fungal-specific transcription factor domain-containing protein n=1 Tax=Roridomyces roridus TaxID=1738132 RepID=A0AAD7CGN0_9AGAR|nr:fungal-specific transcription factor domain-containing protein [Roridomyces roridus]